MLPPKRSLNSSTFFLLLVFTNVLLGCSANHESFVVSRLNESECSFDSLLGLRDFVRTLVYGLGVYDRFPWRSANQIAKFLLNPIPAGTGMHALAIFGMCIFLFSDPNCDSIASPNEILSSYSQDRSFVNYLHCSIS